MTTTTTPASDNNNNNDMTDPEAVTEMNEDTFIDPNEQEYQIEISRLQCERAQAARTTAYERAKAERSAAMQRNDQVKQYTRYEIMASIAKALIGYRKI